ncbi:hypothetical protein [Gimesia maris]|nr:hypothetical protein [Gimesia maris]
MKDTGASFWFSANQAEADVYEIDFRACIGVSGDCFRSGGFVPVWAGG